MTKYDEDIRIDYRPFKIWLRERQIKVYEVAKVLGVTPNNLSCYFSAGKPFRGEWIIALHAVFKIDPLLIPELFFNIDVDEQKEEKIKEIEEKADLNSKTKIIKAFMDSMNEIEKKNLLF